MPLIGKHAMKAKTFLISYQPYPNRDERCTIGALVFDADERVRLHLASNLRKVRAIDPSCNIDTVRESLLEIADHFNQSALAWDAYKSGYGAFRFSDAPGYFIYRDSADYDKQVHSLLSLMAEPRKQEALKDRKEKSRLFLELKRAFDQFGWLAKNLEEINEHKVVTHYPVSLEEQIFAEFAMKNGRLQVVETIDFRSGVSSAKRLEAQGKALVMDYAKDVSRETVCTAIVASTDYSEIKPSLSVLNKYADRVISVNSTADMNEFFRDWGKLLGKPLLPIPPMHT